uniref:Uncharacterized protein n=1 Tax=Anguilla anguilla TaxID=7936 RepID=A0A0E9RUW6_ANGAN
MESRSRVGQQSLFHAINEIALSNGDSDSYAFQIKFHHVSGIM